MKPIKVYPSYLDDWHACGHLYELDRVLRMPRRKSPYMALGTAVDEAITANLTAIRDTGSPLDKDAYTQAFESSWAATHALENFDYMTAELNKEEMHAGGRACIDLHFDLAAKLKPRHIQTFFELDIGDGVILAGKPDFIEEDGLIRDIKTAKKRKSQSDLPRTQAVFYTLCAQYGNPQQDVIGFQLDYLVYGEKSPFYDPRTIVVTQKEIDFVLDDARRFAATVRSGVFARSGRGSWKCSPKWCSHWENCLGASNPVTFNPPINPNY